MANACYDQIRIVSTKSKFRWASIDFTSSTWYINNILRVDSYSPSVLPIVIIMLFAYQKTNWFEFCFENLLKALLQNQSEIDLYIYHLNAFNKNINYQINSLQCEQNVGWRRNVAMNLCPLTCVMGDKSHYWNVFNWLQVPHFRDINTWWTRLRIAPRRRLKAARSLNSGPPTALVLATAPCVLLWSEKMVKQWKILASLISHQNVWKHTVPFQFDDNVNFSHWL